MISSGLSHIMRERTARVATFGGLMNPVVSASQIRSDSGFVNAPVSGSVASIARSCVGTVNRGESQRAAEDGSSKREMRFSILPRLSASGPS